MKKNLITLSYCLILVYLPILAFPQNFKPTFTVKKEPLSKINPKLKYTFGYLEVLENRAKPNGATIKLPVYIFKSKKPNPPKDPVLFLIGGPGLSNMRNAPYAKYYKFLEDRDLIFFEQRGATYAQPNLNCPEWNKAQAKAAYPNLSQQEKQQIMREATRKCREGFVKKGIDLSAYTTKAIADDVEDFRNALKIKQLNLFTVSYGTQIAQVLMRDYPKSIRSVVMDSPLPLEVQYDEEATDYMVKAFKKMFRDCNENTAYRKLGQRFWRFLEAKTKEPLLLNVKHPKTKQSYTFRLRGKNIIQFFDLSSTYGIPTIPQKIEQVLAGDYSQLKKKLQGVLLSKGSSFQIGFRLSVWCAEQAPYNNYQKIQQLSTKNAAIAGYNPKVFEEDICKIWQVKKVAAREKQAVKSKVPVLLLSGSYDPDTPPEWAAQMQKNLPNSFHLIFKGWGHTISLNWGNPCGMQMANAFFNNPTQRPTADCFEKIGKPNFKAGDKSKGKK